MKKLLFVCMGMGLGGTEKTLVTALNALDYSKYDVSLYIRKNRTDLLPYLNKNIHIILNDNVPLFENGFYCKLCGFAQRICNLFKMKELSAKFSRSSRKYVLKKRTEYEKNAFFYNAQYDYAVAYDMATEVAKFVLDVVNAKKRIAFFHASRLYEAKMLLYKEFDKIACVNDIVAADMKSDYPQLAEKVVAVENFIAPEYVINELKKGEPLTRPENKLVLCSCGRIAKEKGFDLATKAAKILKNQGIDFHWFFVGNYLDNGFVENLIKTEGLQQEITVTGFVSNPYKYMEICDIYIQPSYEDAHATTVVEASILCKPIISTDTSTGRLFRDKYNCCNMCVRDEQSLADEILNLYQKNSEINRLIAATKEINYCEKYSEYKKDLDKLFV